jgi:LPXTG-motif cell wall-anchored protein
VALPRTGGEEALAAVALSLIGGALVIRRRRATV